MNDVTTGATAPPSRTVEAEFRTVYSAHYAALVRLAYLSTDSVAIAEEVVQEAFVEWLRRGSAVREPLPYLRRAVISRCTSWVRRRQLEHRHQDRTRPDDAIVVHNPDVQAVRAALRGLNPRQRAAVFMRFYLDLSEAAMAQALDCRPGTVKSLLNRALAAMKEKLDEVD